EYYCSSYAGSQTFIF
nr:immunoglobulin light chain junction region [Macaca mulatta]